MTRTPPPPTRPASDSHRTLAPPSGCDHCTAVPQSSIPALRENLSGLGVASPVALPRTVASLLLAAVFSTSKNAIQVTTQARLVLAGSSVVPGSKPNYPPAIPSPLLHPEDVPAKAEPEYELRRVKRRPGRRDLANFENLPVTTKVYELSAEERICPCCGIERKEIGADESWQIEHIPGRFERIQHIRKKYACPGCEKAGENPQMELAAKGRGGH
jgi:zinc-finger binding domain of transposase IS66